MEIQSVAHTWRCQIPQHVPSQICLQFTSSLFCVNHRNEWPRLLGRTRVKIITLLKIHTVSTGRDLETVPSILPYTEQYLLLQDPWQMSIQYQSEYLQWCTSHYLMKQPILYLDSWQLLSSIFPPSQKQSQLPLGNCYFFIPCGVDRTQGSVLLPGLFALTSIPWLSPAALCMLPCQLGFGRSEQWEALAEDWTVKKGRNHGISPPL